MAVNPQYLAAVKTASAKYGVPAQLLAAQIQAESGWNPSAKSPAGAIGISQFMPGTAKGFGIDPTNPLQSIDAQGKMMSNLLKKYGGSVPLALAGYNAGEGAVAAAGNKVPQNGQTPGYIANILKFEKNYPGLAGGGGLPLPSGGTSTVSTAPETAPVATTAPPQGNQVSPGGLTVGGLLAAAKAHLGNQQADQGTSFIEQALGAAANPQNAALPNGGFSSVPVNTLKVSPDVAAGKLSPSGSGIVQAAMKFKGTPYSWGGGGINGPSKGIAQGSKTTGFDCSGLLQYSVYQATGQKIPRVAAQQYAASTKVPLADAKPGDAVFFGTKSDVHHVGIYIGDGKFIEAPHTGSVVQISNLAGRKDLVGVGRFGGK